MLIVFNIFYITPITIKKNNPNNYQSGDIKLFTNNITSYTLRNNLVKKIILIIFIGFITCFNKGYCGVTVQNTGSTVISTNQMSRPIAVTISTLISLTLNMNVVPLDQYITNTEESSYRIPISQLYLNDGTNNYQMQYNTATTLINGLAIGVLGYTQNYTATVTGIGVLRPGNYTTRLQFNTNTLLSPASTVFTMTFVVPLSQSISTITNPVDITLTPDNVFNSGATITNTVSPQVNLQSNAPWQLIMDTTGIGTLQGNYYFQIINTSSHVTSHLVALTQILPNTQYTLAQGNATVSAPITGSYTNDYITIRYQMQGPSDSYLPEGTYNNIFKYSLQQRDD